MSLPAFGQAYPSKPISIIVPVAAGGMTDITARIFGAKLGEASGITVIVNNRPGAAGIPGTMDAARAAPDGYTLLMDYEGPLATLQYLEPLPFDPEKDLTPIVHLVSAPNVLLVRSTMPVRNVSELLAYARANPGKLSYASQGVGSAGHLAGEMLRLATGVEITHVPYRGAIPAAQDLAGGQVDIMFSTLSSSVQPFIQDGKFRLLGAATKTRVAFIPDVPTLEEQGLPVYMASWFGLLAPKGTDPNSIEWLNKQANVIFSTPEMEKRFAEQGLVLTLGSPISFATFISSERLKFRDIITRARISINP